MNKPAGVGTRLACHQDRWTHLDQDPLIRLWKALDPATIKNGCVQVVAGTHHRLIFPSSEGGFLTEAQTTELLHGAEIIYLELADCECVLLHNHLPHASEINTTDIPRRAFSA